MSDDIFDASNKPKGGWWKAEKVGDRVSGEVMEKWENTEGEFGPQRCFALKQSDGSILNVGLKKSSQYLMQRTIMVEPGDILGVEYKEDVPSKRFKGKTAKSLEVYVRKGDPKKKDDGFGGL